jgi:peptidoglycan-N-acetylglucosamine deacetylase
MRILRKYGVLKHCHRVAAALKWSAMGATNRVSTQEPIVALTFDDGPNSVSTPALLEVLEKFRARATFFMVGEAASKHPKLVELVARGGHAIGNHSWDHPSFPRIGRHERWRQLRACQRALAPYGEKIFRPPFGHLDIPSSLDAWLAGYQVVTWDVAARDWLDQEALWMADRVEMQVHSGSIVLFHDALYTFVDQRYTDRKPMLRAVELVLERMSSRFRFVTVPHLIQHGRANRGEWTVMGRTEVLQKLQEADGRPWRYASEIGRGHQTT